METDILWGREQDNETEIFGRFTLGGTVLNEKIYTFKNW